MSEVLGGFPYLSQISLLRAGRGTHPFLCPSQILEAAYAFWPMTHLPFPKPATAEFFSACSTAIL